MFSLDGFERPIFLPTAAFRIEESARLFVFSGGPCCSLGNPELSLSVSSPSFVCRASMQGLLQAAGRHSRLGLG